MSVFRHPRQRLHPTRRGGRRLDEGVRARMARLIGRDSGDVRIHADDAGERTAAAHDARAVTLGSDIAFAAGHFAPGTPEGDALLAHELTHVAQQRAQAGGSPAGADAAERQAEAVEGLVVGGRPAGPDAIGAIAPAPAAAQRAPKRDARDRARQSPPADVPARTVFFARGSDQLRQDAEAASDVRMAAIVRDARAWLAEPSPEKSVAVHGYASEEGPEAFNAGLADRRAQRVRRLLIAEGLPADKVEAVGHGEDATHAGLDWNRRASVELAPGSVEFDPVVLTGKRPRSGPAPVEKTAWLTQRHKRLRERERIPADPVESWGGIATGRMIAERAVSGRSESLADYKDRWVHAQRHVIVAAAAANDIPDWLLAGVAWAEVGGDPSWIDDLAESKRRTFGGKDPNKTSFGAVSMQIAVAGEDLGYDVGNLSALQAHQIAASLKDPQQNLFLVARHLRRLRDVDFPATPPALLTDEQASVIATRYNRGPGLSVESIRSKGDRTSYGDSVVGKKARLKRLLQD